MVVESTGLSAAARVLAVLSDSAVAAGDVSAHLSVLLHARCLQAECESESEVPCFSISLIY